jgi:hypothetical protein
MPYYRCFVRGEHIPGEVIGSTGLYGFYTTRWVQALNRKRAELRAVNAVRRDPRMALPEGVPTSPHARLYVEEIDQIVRLPRFRGGGATWFAEDEESPGRRDRRGISPAMDRRPSGGWGPRE